MTLDPRYLPASSNGCNDATRARARRRRPTSIANRDATDRVLASLARGVPLDVAASAGPIDRSTLWRWLSRGEADDIADQESPYRRFYADAQRALDDAQRVLVERVHDASAADWRAGVALLQTRWPRRYGPRVHVSATADRFDAESLLTDDERADALKAAMVEFLAERRARAIDTAEVGP